MGAVPAFVLGVCLFACCQVVALGGVAATHVVWEKEEWSLVNTSGSKKRRVKHSGLVVTLRGTVLFTYDRSIPECNWC